MMQIIEDFLKQEQIKFTLGEIWDNPLRQRLSCLCYLEDRGRLLLLRRNKEPFINFWTAPGGKMEPGEDPAQAVIREMKEETGLTVIKPRLRLIASETGNDFDYNWLLFVFRCSQFNGIIKECDEGILSWVSREQWPDIELTEADRRLWSYIFDDRRRYFIRLHYNDRHQVQILREFEL